MKKTNENDSQESNDYECKQEENVISSCHNTLPQNANYIHQFDVV